MKWTPNGIARHYGVPRALDGSGQTIGIINLGETLSVEELRADFAVMGLTMPGLTIRQIAKIAADPDAAIETHIDIEIVASLCPMAQLTVYCCAPSFDDLATAINMAVDDNVDVISVSWGSAEPNLSSGTIRKIEDALGRAQAKAITVCAAAGDFGAAGLSDKTTHLPMNAENAEVSCIYPASSALVLACGGTSFAMDGKGKLTEVVWNDTDRKGRATGGGVSVQFDKPDWQSHIAISSANDGADEGRIIPDVAAVASMVWEFRDRKGRTDIEGGTSTGAPFYAGLIALANQRRAQLGKKRLGFVNARLYELARQGDVFVDIVCGHNKVLPDGLGYEARAGFDACTGWGVPKADRLINELALLP